MKICLYLEFARLNGQASGLGVALSHQKRALELNNIPYTLNWREDFDILHTNFMGPWSIHLVKKAKKQGKRVVIHVHTTSEDFANSFTGSNAVARVAKPIMRNYLSMADVILVPSEYTRDLLVQKYGIQHRIEVLSNGIDTTRCKPSAPEEVKEFQREYHLKRQLVLGLGLVFARKGVDDFIKVGAQFPHASFLWAGRKFNRVLTWSSTVHKALEHLPQNVQFPGFVPNKWVALTAADVFFFPSHEENQGIVILEAAAMGKAIVVRDIPVFQKMLTHGVNCLIARKNEDFVHHIKDLLTNPSLREYLGQQARIFAREHDLQKIGHRLKNIYQSVLDKNKNHHK